ncbi:GntR family transcriptional regulator [Rhodoligotrophos defluvii]|uniref:GntR family transcriptional regulator n=1 Tax=Rhodoligotrophos defluvii TaxID=2561934 RepID=UPI001485332F|nr:GntR family transcriptional regulator [Rhodoligotrophos defluvii]
MTPELAAAGLAKLSTEDGAERDLTVPFLRARSLADQVADAITNAIAQGHIRPGQRLIETELARGLGVSRIPIREAVKMLAAQGIVDTSPHRGTFVVEFDEARIDRICAVRVALERLAGREAAQVYAAEPQRLSRLDAIIDDLSRAAAAGDWIAASRADLAFHREICAASGNDIVAKLWETIARHVLIIFGREVLHERDGTNLARQHRALRDTLASGEVDAIDREIESHIMRLRNMQKEGGT